VDDLRVGDVVGQAERSEPFFSILNNELSDIMECIELRDITKFSD
jgi:hypothetical protein